MMGRVSCELRRLRADDGGSVVIETAFVAPVLAMLALGGFEASRIVSRQVELQTAVSEAAAIVLARPPESTTEFNTIKDVVKTSTKLADGKVTMIQRFRCGSSANLVNASTSCANGEVISEYILLTVVDTYTPIWTKFGIGKAMNFKIVRRLQTS